MGTTRLRIVVSRISTGSDTHREELLSHCHRCHRSEFAILKQDLMRQRFLFQLYTLSQVSQLSQLSQGTFCDFVSQIETRANFYFR